MLDCGVTDGHLDKRLWLRATCLESVFVGQDLHILMEEMGSLSVYLRTLLPQTPSLMFCSMFDINVCFAASKARGTLSFQNHAVLLFWKSQFQSTFSLLFLSAVWPDVTFSLAAVASIKPLQKYASWWSSKTISWATQMGCPAAPHMNIIRGLCIGGLLMRQCCFFFGHVSAQHLPPHTSLNYPEPTDQNALGVFTSVFFCHRVCL